MNILLLMIPLSLLLLAAAVWAFIRAVRGGQFEDLDTPAIDILREDPHERAQRLRRDAEAMPADATSAEPGAADGADPGTPGRDDAPAGGG